MVLHDLTQAVQYSDYMAVIKEGRLVSAGATVDMVNEDLFKDVFSVDVSIDKLDEKSYVRVKCLL